MHIQFDVDYWGHPKTLMLQALLGNAVPRAAEIPPRMWCWASKYAQDGVIQRKMVPAAIGFNTGDSDPIAALLEAGFVEDVDGHSVRIVNWHKRTGSFLERYEAKKERMRLYQAGKKKTEDIRVEERRGEESNVSGYYPDTIRKVAASTQVETPRDEAVRQLFQLAKRQSVAANDDTLRGRIVAWSARIGPEALEQKLMDPSTVGRTVNELHDQWFPKAPPPKPNPGTINGVGVKSFKCATCKDTGKTEVGVDTATRSVILGPCSCQRKRSE
jgi:hypothetical protein